MKIFAFFSAFFTLTFGSDISELEKKVQELYKRMDLIEGKNMTTTKSREKGEVIFRGQSDIGDVYGGSNDAGSVKSFKMDDIFRRSDSTSQDQQEIEIGVAPKKVR